MKFHLNKTLLFIIPFLLLNFSLLGQWSGSSYIHTQISSADIIVPDGEGGFFNTQGNLFFSTGTKVIEKRDSLGILVWSKPFYINEAREPKKLLNDGTGGVIITSSVYNSDGTKGSIVLQRLDRNGNKLWGADGIKIAPGSFTMSCDLIKSSDGAYIFAWTKDNQTQPNNVFIQKFDSTGTLLWPLPGIQISSPGINEWFNWSSSIGMDHTSVLTSDGKGGALITWQRGDYNPTQILCARIDKNGNTVFNKAITNNFAYNRQCLTIVNNNTGGAYIMWSMYDNTTYYDDIWVQQVDSIGNESWAVNGKKLFFPHGVNLNYKAIEDLYGGFIVCLSNTSVDAGQGVGGNAKIYIQRFNKIGNPIWNNIIKVTIDTVKAKPGIALALLNNGKYMVAWRQGRLDTALNTYFQLIDTSGNRLVSDYGNPVDLISPNVMENQLPITISACSDEKKGGFVAWNMYGSLKQYCSRIYPDGSLANHAPVAKFKIILPKQCSDTSKTYVIENMTENGVRYTWDFGDNTIINNQTLGKISHTYSVAGYYKIKLLAKNMFGADSIIRTIGKAKAGFTFTPDTVKLNVGNLVTFTDNSVGAEKYNWLFGDFYSDTIPNPIHGYKSAGIYPVKLIVNNLTCKDTAYSTIIITPCGKFIDTSYIKAPFCLGLCLGDSIEIQGKKELSGYNWSIYRLDTIWSEKFTYPNGTIIGPGNPPKWKRYIAAVGPSGFALKYNRIKW